MNCPKCGAASSDEAEFCGLCYESFRQKAPPAARAAAEGPAASAGAAPRAPRDSRPFVFAGSGVSLLAAFLFELRAAMETAEPATAVLTALGHTGPVGLAIVALAAGVVALIHSFPIEGENRWLVSAGLFGLGLAVIAGLWLSLRQARSSAWEKGFEAARERERLYSETDNEKALARLRGLVTRYHRNAQEYPSQLPPDPASAARGRMAVHPNEWALPVHVRPYHSKTSQVAYGARPDDAGGWLFDNVPTDEGWGKLWVNCTHTDSNGKSWTAY